MENHTADDYRHDAEKVKALAEARAIDDEVTRLLILDELKSWLPEFEEREERVHSRVWSG